MMNQNTSCYKNFWKS